MNPLPRDMQTLPDQPGGPQRVPAGDPPLHLHQHIQVVFRLLLTFEGKDSKHLTGWFKIHVVFMFMSIFCAFTSLC